MSTPKPPIPPLYGGPLGSLLATIQNRGRGERVPADLGATGFRPTQPTPPQPTYTTLPDGSMVQLPGQVEPFTGTPMQPERPMPPMQPEPLPGYPIEPQRPVPYPDDIYTTMPVDMPYTGPFPGTPMQPSRPDPAYSPSYGDINSFVQANMGDPRAIADAIGKYGVSASDLAGATGYNSDQINQYFSNAGISPFDSMKTQDPAVQDPRPNPVPNVLPSDMDFMRQNGII